MLKNKSIFEQETVITKTSFENYMQEIAPGLKVTEEENDDSEPRARGIATVVAVAVAKPIVVGLVKYFAKRANNKWNLTEKIMKVFAGIKKYSEQKINDMTELVEETTGIKIPLQAIGNENEAWQEAKNSILNALLEEIQGQLTGEKSSEMIQEILESLKVEASEALTKI